VPPAGIAEDRKGWLFRTGPRHAATVLTEQPMAQADAWRMIRRRAAADIMAPIGNHSFRATGITAYLDSGGVHDHRNRCSRSAGIRVHNQLEQMFKIDRIQRSRFTGTRRNASQRHAHGHYR
jgi:hypothetical protein